MSGHYTDEETLDQLQAEPGSTFGGWVLDSGYVFLIDYEIFQDGHENFVYDYIGSKYGMGYADGYDSYEMEMDQIDRDVLESAYNYINQAVVDAWGWIRLFMDSALMKTYNRRDMKRAAKGFEKMYPEEYWDKVFNVESLNEDKMVYDVPFEVLESGNPGELKTYR